VAAHSSDTSEQTCHPTLSEAHKTMHHENLKAYISKYVPLVNPLNAELNPTCYLLALLGVHHILHVSGVRVNYNATKTCGGVKVINPHILNLRTGLQ
jgi:hypothetical protein